MSSWFWDDCEGMSDIQKEQLAALLDGKEPDLMNEIRETAEKFDRDIRESRGENVTKPINNEITKEENFTKIPWFLMMRANFLKNWRYWLVGTAANVELTKFIETARAPYDPNDIVRLIVPLSWCVIVFWALANLYFDCQQYFEVDNIRKKMLKYKENMDDSLSFDDIGGYGINRGAIVRYLSKKNPEIFDRMITTPASVKDDKITENIILGHLRSCPGDAQRAFDTFGKSLSAKVSRRVQRYNNRQR